MKLRMPKLEVEGAADRQKSLSNDDLLPIPAERRTWDFWTFTTFWFSAGVFWAWGLVRYERN